MAIDLIGHNGAMGPCVQCGKTAGECRCYELYRYKIRCSVCGAVEGSPCVDRVHAENRSVLSSSNG